MFKPMSTIEQKKTKILEGRKLEEQERSKIFKCIVDEGEYYHYTNLNGITHKEYKALPSIERKRVRRNQYGY